MAMLCDAGIFSGKKIDFDLLTHFSVQKKFSSFSNSIRIIQSQYLLELFFMNVFFGNFVEQCGEESSPSDAKKQVNIAIWLGIFGE